MQHVLPHPYCVHLLLLLLLSPLLVPAQSVTKELFFIRPFLVQEADPFLLLLLLPLNGSHNYTSE